MRVELIERLAADAARSAVLEKEDRTLAGLDDGFVETGEIEDWVQLFHAVPSLYRVGGVYPARPFGSVRPAIDATSYGNRRLRAPFAQR